MSEKHLYQILQDLKGVFVLQLQESKRFESVAPGHLTRSPLPVGL